MTAPALTLADALARISQLAPDLIVTKPRGPLWDVTTDTPDHLRPAPDFGPLLFWGDDLSWRAGKFDCLACGRTEDGDLEVSPIDVIRLLPGLMACCHKRGWTESLTNWRTHYAAVVRGTHERVIGHAEGPTPTEALARAIAMGLTARDDV